MMEHSFSQLGNKQGNDGQFYCPFDVCIGSNGIILVADFGNHRIQSFECNGTFVCKWESKALMMDSFIVQSTFALVRMASFLSPTHITVESNRLIVMEHLFSNGESKASMMDSSKCAFTLMVWMASSTSVTN